MLLKVFEGRWRQWVWLCLLLASELAGAGIPQPDVQAIEQGRQIVINLPQTRLFLYLDGQLVDSFPVTVGKMLTKTPLGRFILTGIYPDPAWHVPKSIQAEMKAQGKPVQSIMPPGKDNPLGQMFMRFGEPGLGLGIHGTNAPASVPGFRSHGCVRMKNPDVLALSRQVKVGDQVTVIYQSVLLNQDPAGHLWMTVYRNPYAHDDVSMEWLAQVLLKWQHTHRRAVYGIRVDQALKRRNGKPVCLSCRHAAPDYHKVDLLALPWLSTGPDDMPEQESAPSQSGQQESWPD